MINYSLTKAFVFLNRLSETQYKCSQGDPFEKVGGAGHGGRPRLDLEGGTPPS